MKFSKIAGLILVALLVSFSFKPVSAGDTGWYSGMGIGVSDADVCTEPTSGRKGPRHGRTYNNDSDSDSGGGESAASCASEDELAFRIFGGKSNVFAFGGEQGKAVQLGAELGYANLGDFAGAELDAIDLTAAARISIAVAEVIGRVGYSYWDAEGAGVDGTDVTWALGLEKNFGPATARLEYQDYKIDTENVDTIMLSGIVNF